MSNYSRYSVFLDSDGARLLAWFIGLVGVPTNFFIFWTMIFESNIGRKRNRTNSHYSEAMNIRKNPSLLLLFNLVTCELLGSMHVLILAASDSYYTNHFQSIHGVNISFTQITNKWFISPTCTFARFLSHIANILSTSFTFLITVDRFILTVYPRSNKKINMKKCLMMICIYWPVGIAISVGLTVFTVVGIHQRSPYTFQFLLNFCHGDYDLTNTHRTLGAVTVFYSFLSYVIITVMYIMMIRKLHRSRTLFNSQASLALEKRFQIMLGLITLTNLFGFIIIIISTGMAIAAGEARADQFQKLINLLPFANYAIDPVFYIVFRYQTNISKMFAKCLPKSSKIASIPIQKAQRTRTEQTKSSNAHSSDVIQIQDSNDYNRSKCHVQDIN